MSRDRAIIALLYESGCRIGERGRLTGERVRFVAYGVIITIDDTKCSTQRDVRMGMARPYLAAWMSNYPFEPGGDALVFVTSRKKPLSHGTVFRQLKRFGERARIEKRIRPHIFLHPASRRSQSWNGSGTLPTRRTPLAPLQTGLAEQSHG